MKNAVNPYSRIQNLALPLSNDLSKNIYTAPGTVIVDFVTSASPEKVWQALTEPSIVDRWFGTLTSPLCPGESTCLDFGDGDFFILDGVQLHPPDFLQYNWRFLGIGLLNIITWRILSQDGKCLVRVIDEEPDRSVDSVQVLYEGWQDFTQRLEQFLSTGVPTRYDWRREFDGGIELSDGVEAAWDRLFSSPLVARWLSLSGTSLRSGEYLILNGAITPTQFQICNITWEAPTRVQFRITHPDWSQPTNCEIVLSPYRDRSVLTVTHVGWETISHDCYQQLHQRKCFSVFWTEALQHAARLNISERNSTNI